MIKLLSFIKGYVYISAESVFLERFFNVLSKNNIRIWGVKKRGLGQVTFYISVKAVEHLRQLANNTDTHIKIIKKTGIPFILFNLSKRKALWISGIFIIVFLIVMNFFVWDIEVRLTDEYGKTKNITIGLPIHIGQLKSSIDKERLANIILLTSNEYSYANVNIEGTVVTIDLRKRINAGEEPDDRACSIIAKRAGVIESINVTQGEKIVNKGDSVGEGDLLVSGIVETKDFGARLVHSKAEIKGITWHTKSAVIELKEKVVNRTGKSKRMHSLSAFGYKLPLYFSNKINYAQHQDVKGVYKLKFNHFVLPFSFNYDRIYETKDTYKNITEYQSVIKLKKVLKEQVQKELAKDAKILEDKYTIKTIETGEKSLEYEAKVSEDLGVIKYEE